MKRISLICGFLLAMALTFTGCASLTDGAGTPVFDGATEPSASPVDNETEPGQSAATVILDYEDVSITEAEGSLLLKIPDGWACEVFPKGSDALIAAEYGFHIYPKDVPEGFVEVGFVKSFGVCGTGLEEKEMTIAGERAVAGTYDNQKYWSFLSFKEKNIVALTNSVAGWFPEHEDQLLEILNTLQFDKGDGGEELEPDGDPGGYDPPPKGQEKNGKEVSEQDPEGAAEPETTEMCSYPTAEDTKN